MGSDTSYFSKLADKGYFSPKEDILEKCVSFTKEIEADLVRLKAIDVSGELPHFNPTGINLDYDCLSFLNMPVDVESKEILESLLKGYAIINIKD